jgi:hypothetical protein
MYIIKYKHDQVKVKIWRKFIYLTIANSPKYNPFFSFSRQNASVKAKSQAYPWESGEEGRRGLLSPAAN